MEQGLFECLDDKVLTRVLLAGVNHTICMTHRREHAAATQCYEIAKICEVAKILHPICETATMCFKCVVCVCVSLGVVIQSKLHMQVNTISVSMRVCSD